MRLAKIISLIGVLAMSGIITWAFTSGNFSEEGGKLLSMPWGIVSMVDLTVGFTLFSCWIIYREKVAGAIRYLGHPDDDARLFHRQPVCLHRAANQWRRLETFLDGQKVQRCLTPVTYLRWPA